MEEVSCRFCGRNDGDGHLFWECTFPLLQLRITQVFSQVFSKSFDKMSSGFTFGDNSVKLSIFKFL